MKLDWIQVYGGNKVYPLNLQEKDIDISVIAHSLSMLCRFGGHTLKFYSVAQHCVQASWIVPAKDALWALLHDASEAYLSDLPTPIKHLDCMLEYRLAEQRAMDTICRKFGLPEKEPVNVKFADDVMLATEARDLMAPMHPEWDEWIDVEPLRETIIPWTSGYAETQFLQRFHNLAGHRIETIDEQLRKGDD